MTTFSVNTDYLSASLGGSSVVLGDAEKNSIALQIQTFVNNNAQLVQTTLQKHGHQSARDFKVIIRNNGEVFLKTQDQHLINLSQRVDSTIFQQVTQAATRAAPAPYAPPISAPYTAPTYPQPYSQQPSSYAPVPMNTPPIHPAIPVAGEIQAQIEPTGLRKPIEREATPARETTQPIINYFKEALNEQREELAKQDQAYYLLYTQLLNNSNETLNLKIKHVQEKLDKVNQELNTYSFSIPESFNDVHPNSIPLKNIGVAYRNIAQRGRYKELVKQKQDLEREIAGFRKEQDGNEELIRCPKNERASKIRIEKLEGELHTLQEHNKELSELLQELLAERTHTVPPVGRSYPPRIPPRGPIQPDPRFSSTPSSTPSHPAQAPYKAPQTTPQVRFTDGFQPPLRTGLVQQKPEYTAIQIDPDDPTSSS